MKTVKLTDRIETDTESLPTIFPEPVVALLLDVRDYLIRGVRSGLVWPLLAIVGLVVASVTPWLGVQLYETLKASDFPVDLGWGVRNHYFSYGAYCDLVALVILVITVQAFRTSRKHRIVARDGTVLIRPWPLIAAALLALLPTVQFIFQFLLVDYLKLQSLANQQYQSLQIQSYLGYSIATPLFPQNTSLTNPTTAVDTSTITGTVWLSGQFVPGGRLALLLALFRPGMLLPLIASLLCFFGAYSSWRQFHQLPERIRRRPRRPLPRWQLAALAVGILMALVVFSRAPVAVFFEQQGNQAFASGDYRGALKDYYRAETLNPTYQYLPSFHQERGRALYMLNPQSTDPDVGLYLANRFRLLGLMQQAWNTDQQLLQAYPNNTMVQSDATLTLIVLVDQSTSLATTPPDNEQIAQQPFLVVNTSSADTALPWLNTLLAEQPDNIYAHYVRGRILYSQGSYESAVIDFQAIISLATDPDMLSTSYTYLSFCQTNMGNYAEGRTLLIKAVNLDYGYNNTIAREAASGLH